MKQGDLLRAIEVPEPQVCSCGKTIMFIGVSLNQPQPRYGDYSMCPRCCAMYVVRENFRLVRVREKDIPTEYLLARDKFLAEWVDK